MKKVLRRAGILSLIFVGTLVVYSISIRNTMEKKSTVYTSIEGPFLPVVHTRPGGQEINRLHGYMQDMGNQVAGESISVLSEDHGLYIQIQEHGNTVTGTSYEARNLAMDRLVEGTKVEDWDSGGEGVNAVLPIQNLSARNETYLLLITVSMGEEESHYYIRITWPDNTYMSDMIRLVGEFTRKGLDYNQARDLVSYLETNDTEDNSPLGHVTIRTNFSHLTWDGLDVEMVGEPQMTLQEFDDIVGQTRIRYQVAINEEDGTCSLVDTADDFIVKWNEQRICLMNYERNANEMFDGSHQFFSGRKILLGIINDNEVRMMKSPKSKRVALKIGGDLWCYDYDNKQAVCVLSFKGNSDDGVRGGYDRRDVRILSMQDDGVTGPLVYGHMNQGKYEGRVGMIFYCYDREQGMVQGKFFLSASESYGMVKTGIDKLSYLSENDVMYITPQDTVYGIGLKNNEFLVMAQGLTEGDYAVSEDVSRLAWQEGQNLYESEKVHVMDFNVSQKQEIMGEINDHVRVLGFVGNDLIYGLSSPKDKWAVSGRMKDVPTYAIHIVNTRIRVGSEYRKDGIYITDVVAQDGRIHLGRLVPLGKSQYLYQNEDTIVCNRRVEEDPLEGAGWFASQDKGKVYFVQSNPEINGDKVRTSAPKVFSYEYTSVLDTGSAASLSSDSSVVFKTYGGGYYISSSRNPSQVVEMAYGQMGCVMDSSQHIMWDRISRQPICNTRSPVGEARKMTRYLDSLSSSRVYEDEFTLIDAGGCNLIQMLYYTNEGIPVAAYVESGQYMLLPGYDQYNVTLYDPQTQEIQKMGLSDATEYFKSLQNDFPYALAVK